MDTQRPKYLYPDGNVVMHSPLRLRNADMYGFFVKVTWRHCKPPSTGR